jgi:heme A synthase
MEKIGGVFGLIGLLSVIYLVSRPILQAVVERLRKQGKTLPNLLKKVYQFVNKTHRYAGFVAVGAIALHFILQYSYYKEIPVAGLIAGLALAAQSVLGYGLTKQKDNDHGKKMALAHRVLGMIIVVAVLAHRLS